MHCSHVDPIRPFRNKYSLVVTVEFKLLVEYHQVVVQYNPYIIVICVLKCDGRDPETQFLLSVDLRTVGLCCSVVVNLHTVCKMLIASCHIDALAK